MIYILKLYEHLMRVICHTPHGPIGIRHVLPAIFVGSFFALFTNGNKHSYPISRKSFKFYGT